MRIFTAVRHSLDPRQFYGGLWSGNFYPALRRLGHEIVESTTDLLPASYFMDVAGTFDSQQREIRARITESIVSEIKAAHQNQPLDLCLFYFYNAHFDPAGFDEIHALGAPTINFFCNSIFQFELVEAMARKATFSWHAERDARASYLAVGAKPIWVQMAADPGVYHPVDIGTRRPRAVFAGMNYADRSDLMASLIRAQVPVEIYGPGWGVNRTNTPAPTSSSAQPVSQRGTSSGTLGSYGKLVWDTLKRKGVAAPKRLLRQWQVRQKQRQLMPLFIPHAKGAVPFTELAKIFSSYEMCLNFSNVWSDGRPGSDLIPHVRLRDFEAPMCRTCYLTGYTDELAGFYELGKEVETYATADELVDKAKFYLANPVAAERLREAGFERALRDHTWDRRFEELFSKVGMTASAP